MRENLEFTDDRARRRRIRRLKRYARLVGPFLAIPLLVAALSLSVDLIEYQSQPSDQDHLLDRPIRHLPRPNAARSAALTPVRVSAQDAEALISTLPQAALDADASDHEFELTPPPHPSPPPYALHDR